MRDIRLVDISIVFIATMVLIWTLQQFQSFLRPFTVAVILTLLIMPLVRWCKRKQIPFWLVLIGIVLGFIATITILALLMQSGDTGEQEGSLQEKIGLTVQSMSQLTLFGQTVSLQEFINPEKIGGWISKLVTSALDAAQAISSELLIILLFLMFLIPSYEIFVRDIEKHLKGSQARKFKQVVLEIEKSIKDYLATKAVISLGTAVVSAIILLVFGADFVVALALLIFALNFIPNIGSFVAVGIAIIATLLTSGFGWGLVVMSILLIVTQFVFGGIVEPKIAGNKLNLSPIVILLGLFLWGWIWDVIGMLLAVPLTAIIKIVLSHIEKTKTIAKFMS